MPRLDDPKLKLRANKKFIRKNLRPWNDANELKPLASVENEQKNGNQIVSINKTYSNHLTNQLVSKNETLSIHTGPSFAPLVNNNETISNLNGKQINGTISNQIANQLVNKNTIFEEIKRLTGLQMKLMLYILENCTSRGLLYTTPIPSTNLKILLETDINTVKTTAQRLVNKSLITRENGKKGRGGFCIFRITEEVRNATLEAKRQWGINNQIVNQLVSSYSNQLVTNKLSNKETNTSSSSSIIKYINTTTTDAPDVELPDEWQTVDITALENIGFSQSYLRQILKQGKLSPQEVQDSIYAFAFDLSENDKGKGLKTFPLNFFMGILKKGLVYNAPPNYETPQDRARRLYLERKRQEEAKKVAEEEALFKFAFDEWYQALSEQEKAEISGIIKNDHGRRALAEKRFREHLWPTKRQEILEGVAT